MATMSNNDLWILTHNVEGPGTVTDILATENKFVDKNISIKVVTPTASGPTLTLTDKGNSDITVSSVTAINSKNYYILSTSLSGQLSVSTPGWISSEGLGAPDDVQVGRIIQSSLSNTSDIIPAVGSNQTVYITPGYYSTTRTIAIKGMSSGTTAVATVTATKQATAPTLNNTAVTISGMTQVGLSTTSTILTSAAGKYFVAMTATAPGVTITPTININTQGYLGTANQITANASTTAKGQTFYSVLPTGAVKVTSSKTATAPTIADRSVTPTTAVYVQAAPTTTQPTSGYFYSVRLTAPATTLTNTATITTPGYIGDTSEITMSAATTAKTADYYIPIPSGSLSEAGQSGVSNYKVLTGPILDVNDGFLYINAGYFENSKISIGTLLPDPTSAPNATSAKMLAGYEAFDVDGNVLLGTIQTYTGLYTVSTS